MNPEDARFVLMQSGKPMEDDTGKIHLFTPKEAHLMLIDDRIPRSWWATRKFEKYKEAK